MARSMWLGVGVAALVGLVGQGRADPVASPQPPAAAPKPAADLSTPGSGAVILTNPQALACQDAAKVGDFNGAGVQQCTLALGASLLSERDIAAILTDRGAVYLQHRKYELAKTDFDAALKLDASTADAYVDRGAALLGQKQYAEAIADIDRGLALGPDQPEKAYFNRAIADEHLNDLKSAYQDYLKASQLNPKWDAPKRELAGLAR